MPPQRRMTFTDLNIAISYLLLNDKLATDSEILTFGRTLHSSSSEAPHYLDQNIYFKITITNRIHKYNARSIF